MKISFVDHGDLYEESMFDVLLPKEHMKVRMKICNQEGQGMVPPGISFLLLHYPLSLILKPVAIEQSHYL